VDKGLEEGRARFSVQQWRYVDLWFSRIFLSFFFSF